LDFWKDLDVFLDFKQKSGDALKKTGQNNAQFETRRIFDSEQQRALRGHHGWSSLGSFGTRCTKRCVPDADPEVVILGRVPKVKSISFRKVLRI